MSAPQIPEEAVEAGAKALAIFGVQLADRADSRMVLAAALPHIERAVIQRLIEKLTNTEPGPNWLGYKAWACDWLRAELEGGDQ